jgi:predicted dehydrogenase
MTEPIRIGIVGAGRIVAAEHVPRFRAIEGVELVGVANRSEDSSRRAADELELPRAYSSWQEVIEDPDLDAVLVGAWPVLHAPVAMAALDAGKHVLTEARMAATAEDARAMVRAARAHPDLVALVVPATFSAWADVTIVRLLREGAIGRVRHVQVSWDASGPADPGDFWRWQQASSGENIMALGILAEAMTRWLGQPEAVTAVTRLGPAERPGPNGPIRADVPDHVLALVEYPDDVTATVEMSARTNGIASDHATFHGTAGSVVVDLGAQRIELVRGDSRETIEIRDEDRGGWTAEADFVSAIRGGSTGTLTDFEIGLGYMAFLEAVHRSAATGCRTIIEGETP